MYAFIIGGPVKKNISLIQMDVKLGDSEANYRNAEKLMNEALQSNPDIIVFPETMNVGFFPKDTLQESADKEGRIAKAFFGDYASKHNVNIIAGSIITMQDQSVYNTSYAFNRQGEVVATYNKIHNFSPMDEHKFFAGGNQSVIFTLDDITCSTIICYDVRFPELARSLALQGVELLFIPAQWPSIRRMPWETLTRARAIENQFYVCAVNACGVAGETQFGGTSHLWSPLGEDITHFGPTEEVQTATIDIQQVATIREQINVFRDRRPDTYQV